MDTIEILGTASSVIVAVSLTLKNIRTLRIINTVGALGFSIYGWVIGAYPVLGLNSFIVLVNIFYLYRMAMAEAHFSLIQVPVDSPLLGSFLEVYRSDLKKFHPDYEVSLKDSNHLFILREGVPLALVILTPKEKDVWEIVVDYTIPSNRDLKGARWFYSQIRKGTFLFPVKYLDCTAIKPQVVRYLKKLGFKKMGEDSYRFIP